VHFNKKVLPSGLRIITAPMKDNPTVTVLVMVEAGSKYETKDTSGISHFLEHMCFKGTKTRPTALAITKELDSIGAHYNAFTGHEYTGYFAKADCRHLETVLDVVSDLYLNPTLPPPEVEREKGVIIEEINMYEDLPQRRVQDLFMELLYGDQPAGWPVTGSKESVAAATRDKIAAYRGKHYVSGATAVAVAGGFDEDKLLKQLENRFTGISVGSKHPKTRVNERSDGPKALVKSKETDQTHLVLGVRTFDIYHKARPVLKVLAGVLGGGMSSRLFQKVREEMAAGYYIGVSPEFFTDHGFLEVAAGVKHEKVYDVIKAVLAEFKRLADQAVPPDELRKVKDYLIGTMYLALEPSDAIAEYYAVQEILRQPKIKNPGETAAEVESVTASDVKALAGELFKDDRLNLALVGRLKDGGEFSSVLKF